MRPRKKNRHLPACVYQRHGAYYFVKGGKWIRIGTDLREALDQYQRISGSRQGSIDSLIDDFLVAAKERGAKPNTLIQYSMAAAKLKAALVEFAPDQLEPRHVARLMDHYRSTPNMANRMRTVLKMAFDAAVLRGLCAQNPVTSVPRHKEKRRDRYLTDVEFRAIHSAGNAVIRVIMDLAYLTGQRIGDVLRIRLSDITEAGIEFRQQKTGKRLCVRMTVELSQAIAAAKTMHGGATRMYLLGQRNGRLRSYRGVRDLFERARDLAGIQDVTLHDLRAKALTDAKRQGKDPQALGGHSTEAMTNRYLRDRETTFVEGPSIGHVQNNGR